MYLSLKPETEEKIRRDRAEGAFFGTPDDSAVRYKANKNDAATLFRPPFVRDIGKMINLPAYIRLQDKTQVLSRYKNDDISHRMTHVQYVSRIARDIARSLLLNCDLVEAIALGHDLGHAPFGHAGEAALDAVMKKELGLSFNHNVQSVRVLTKMYDRNITLQTLDGVLCHNGELGQKEYVPVGLRGFEGLYSSVDCAERTGDIGHLTPGTIEGCVVRICDIVAYIGKDRQDARKLGLIDEGAFGSDWDNAELINNISVDIIENSYDRRGKVLCMSDGIFETLERAMAENYKKIYLSDSVRSVYEPIGPMFGELFGALCADMKRDGGFVRKYCTDPIVRYNPEYAKEPVERIACDFIASMTDDFFIAAYERLTGKKCTARFVDYFE